MKARRIPQDPAGGVFAGRDLLNIFRQDLLNIFRRDLQDIFRRDPLNIFK